MLDRRDAVRLLSGRKDSSLCRAGGRSDVNSLSNLRLASTSSSSADSSSASSLAAAASAALARSLFPEIINDPFASLLAEAAGQKQKGEIEEEEGGANETSLSATPPHAAFAAAAAAFADDTLLRATDLVNLEAGDRKGVEYRQVVVLGPGLDSRPQRLWWPAGTVLFECASADAHSVAAAVLASDRARELAAEAAKAEAGEEEGVFTAFNGSKAPRGRLLRRVVCDISSETGREALGEALFAAGFRAERLSVWCVSAGAFDHSFDVEAIGQLLGAVASCAAFCSFVVGDLPPMTRAEAEGAVAGSGLLASVVAFGSEEEGDEAGAALWRKRGWTSETQGGEKERQRWLFVGQQRSRSDAELGILRAFSEAAEDAEGFEDNVS